MFTLHVKFFSIDLLFAKYGHRLSSHRDLIFTFIQVNNANPKNNSVKVLNRTIAINSFKIPGEINDY